MGSIVMRFYVSNTISSVEMTGDAGASEGPLTIENYAFDAVSRPERGIIDRTSSPEPNR